MYSLWILCRSLSRVYYSGGLRRLCRKRTILFVVDVFCDYNEKGSAVRGMEWLLLDPCLMLKNGLFLAFEMSFRAFKWACFFCPAENRLNEAVADRKLTV